MARYQNIEEQLTEMNIEEEENEGFAFEEDIVENVNKYELCLVGRFLTEKNVNSRTMKTKIADLWKPTMGINIKELEQGIFLFQFYTRKTSMLIVDSIPPGEDPVKFHYGF